MAVAILKRTLLLLLGWLLVAWGLVMAGGGHALWRVFGAATIGSGLVQATAIVVAGDALLVWVVLMNGSERLKVVFGVFAVAGIFLSVASFGAIRHAWVAGA
jgi:hypothetical protein